MSGVLLDTRTEIDPITGEARCSHIIAPTADKSAMDLVFEARVNGTSVTAICGHTWVPERDAKKFPLCSRCREIREQSRPDQDPTEIPS